MSIVYLNKHAGMSHGKVSQAFDKLFGIKVTPGASAQVVMRAGKILQPVYDEIAAKIDKLMPRTGRGITNG